MRIRTAAPIAALLTTLALAACGTSEGAGATGTPTGTPSGTGPVAASATPSPPAASPSVAPSPSVDVPTVAELTQQVNSARMATVPGSRFSSPDRSGTPPLDVCGGNISAYAQVKAVNIEVWLGTSVPLLRESVFGFQALTGADVVAQARTLATSCVTHQQTAVGETLQITRLDGPKIAAPAGVDAFYVFCETQKVLKPAIAAGVAVSYCTAVMGRGNVAVFLNAGQSTSLSVARAGLVKFLPAAARTLVSAVRS